MTPNSSNPEKKTEETAGEDGAITVDWVVITAIVVLFGTVVIAILVPGIMDGASTIYTDLSSTGR